LEGKLKVVFRCEVGLKYICVAGSVQFSDVTGKNHVSFFISEENFVVVTDVYKFLF
jgi:hypothetical protein